MIINTIVSNRYAFLFYTDRNILNTRNMETQTTTDRLGTLMLFILYKVRWQKNIEKKKITIPISVFYHF